MTIQVEALERLKSDGHNLHQGDRVTIEDDIARLWCGAGWAKAVKGEVETGQRRVVKAVMEPSSAIHQSTADEVKANG